MVPRELRRLLNFVCMYLGIKPEQVLRRRVERGLLPHVSLSITARARESYRRMRRRERAGQQQSDIETPCPPLQELIFSVQNIRCLRGHLAQKGKIAIFDLFGPDAAKPFSPMRRQVEPLIGPRPEPRHQLAKRGPRSDQFSRSTRSARTFPHIQSSSSPSKPASCFLSGEFQNFKGCLAPVRAARVGANVGARRSYLGNFAASTTV